MTKADLIKYLEDVPDDAELETYVDDWETKPIENITIEKRPVAEKCKVIIW